MRFVILSILSWHPRLKKCKTCGSKHIRILEEDPVKSTRHISYHFIGQKDGGVQARSHSSRSNFLKSICLHYREFSIWKLLNNKQEIRVAEDIVQNTGPCSVTLSVPALTGFPCGCLCLCLQKRSAHVGGRSDICPAASHANLWSLKLT